jgi:hypothetical protein
MEWLDKLDKEEKAKRVAQAFASIMQSEDGQIATYAILTALFFFDPSPGDEERILNNAAKRIVALMGDDVRYRLFHALTLTGR